ncbi:hypothetical protein J4Q44_G00368200 [Coregonus suidteri]|uniref:Uncharacterized protein n=1 Tax=Coregonus suidteri TaxID=861788 RepID=A0AAN8KEJ2_9TELE
MHLLHQLQRKAADVEAWKGLRELLHMPAVELECPPPNAICSVCRVLEEAELWRLWGIVAQINISVCPCAVRIHSTPNIVHQLELWKFFSCELEPVTLIRHRLGLPPPPPTPHLPETAISVDIPRQFAAADAAGVWGVFEGEYLAFPEATQLQPCRPCKPGTRPRASNVSKLASWATSCRISFRAQHQHC